MMTNFEHYKEEIKKATDEVYLYLFLKQHGCDSVDSYAVTKWFLAKYVESYKLTRFEYELLKYLDSQGFTHIENDYDDVYFKIITTDCNYSSNPDIFKNFFEGVFSENCHEVVPIKNILNNCEVID